MDTKFDRIVTGQVMLTPAEIRKVESGAVAQDKLARAHAKKYRDREQKKMENKRKAAIKEEKNPEKKRQLRTILAAEKKENKILNRLSNAVMKNQKKIAVAQRKKELGIPLSKREQAKLDQYGPRKAQALADMTLQAKHMQLNTRNAMEKAGAEGAAIYEARLTHLEELDQDPITVGKQHLTDKEKAAWTAAGSKPKGERYAEEERRKADYDRQVRAYSDQRVQENIEKLTEAGVVTKEPVPREKLAEYMDTLKKTDGLSKGSRDALYRQQEERTAKAEREKKEPSLGER